MEGVADLTIRIKQGITVRVDLYSLEDCMTEAFSAGPTFESREYFRGEHSKLEAALAKAYHVHLRSLGVSPSSKQLNAGGNR